MPTFPSTTSYIVFCRHGQRLPSRNLSLENVAAAWDWEKHLFPIIDDATNVEGKAELLNKHAQVCKAFPVHSADQQKYNRSTFESPQFVPHDLAHFPFGSLSTTGAHYMEQQGKELKKRFPGLLHFDRSQFEIFSTNYLRTQVTFLFRKPSPSMQ